MALTYKERLEFLESLRKAPIDLSVADRMVLYAHDRTLMRPTIQSLVRELTNLDAYISVMHGILTQDEWDEVVSDYDTPIEGGHAKLREKIKLFLFAYENLDNAIYDFKIDEVFKAFETSMLSRTRNIQFLLFKLCHRNPQAVFGFLLELVRKNPIAFLPYLSSLIVRCKVDEGLKAMYVQDYQAYVRSYGKSLSIQSVAAHQCLLYISCFRRESVADAKDIIERIFSSGMARYMNKNVVEMFCELFDYECKEFSSHDHDCLYFFPFDLPILEEVAGSIHEFYIHFRR
ncbi:uncharacterized protein Eint_090740 [Encephalitozoon intestinalis ATCC 50506]|uniref:Uncharacterized protein n=1 Tax=Encephalitozoon intestinalis (strain ATCC 50506) TaxID=876142 RepID=E0S9D9_ENCIT|nr:uncharacterized protein Eint_090740 [Encephalitozoon intestinalis ATCC 50506]ADM12203.1 hypothetical protein Eint_090740 [Encephalitozoon intestinalis ATCC 50506]UTX46010.1 hypothetical protein GPK93_09g15960 [Encephalitozoon intestinalis]